MSMFRRLKAPSSLGLQKLGHDLVHRRYRFRQFVGIGFLFVLTFLGNPGDHRGIDAVPLIAHQRFAGQLEEDAGVRRT